jgi:hypothetical protein
MVQSYFMHMQYGFTLIIIGHVMHRHIFLVSFQTIYNSITKQKQCYRIFNYCITHPKTNKMWKKEIFSESVTALPVTVTVYNVHAT